MGRDVVRYALLVAVPALLFFSAGVWQPARLEREMRSDHAQLVSARRRALASGMRHAAKGVADDRGRLEAVTAAAREEGVDVKGGFVWRKGEGAVAHSGLSGGTLEALGPDRRWTVGGLVGATAAYNWERLGDDMVFWCRLPGNTVAGVAGERPPDDGTAKPFAVVLCGGCLVAVLAVSLLAASWSWVREAKRARKEALTKTNFVSLVSHELKTPLAGIVPYAAMLSKGKITDPEDLREAYVTIADESRRLAAMVDGLLEFSRLDTGNRRFRIEGFVAAEVATEAVKVMERRPGGSKATVSGDTEARVSADRDAVKGILLNLLDNAVKYAPGGGVEIEVARREDGTVAVAVADRGPGLDPERRELAFSAFWRADDRTVAETGGFGLGLAISRLAARGMGGDLDVAPRPGGGSVFTLTLKEEVQNG